MRRLALILTLLAGSIAGLAATASGEDAKTYYIEMDNAFGLVNGSEVKVAGVTAGTVSELLINSQKRAVAKVELTGPVAVLGEDTVCRTEPQSLIAEYFIDCTPKGNPIAEGSGDADSRMEDPDIPVEQTQQTVQQDLVFSTMRQPFRERLTLLINEFGTALAGNPENLNSAIRRGAPALTETKQIFNLLADQASTIRDLNVDSDEIIGKLAARRADVVDFIEEANDTAVASAERRDDLSQNFALLDDFLAELKPTMVELNGLAVAGTPLAANLRRAAPGLNTLSRNLPDFNSSATDAVVSLGRTSVTGQRALDKGRDEIKQLGQAAKNSFPTADTLAKFLRDIDDPDRAVATDTRANRDTGRKGEQGYTGMEGLLNYVYYQPGAINQYDEIGHMLHFSIFEIGSGPCEAYNAAQEFPREDATGPPGSPGYTTTTDPRQANRCVAILGDNQPGINAGPTLPAYDRSVCPENPPNPDDFCEDSATAARSLRAEQDTSATEDEDATTEEPTEPPTTEEPTEPPTDGLPDVPEVPGDGATGSGGGLDDVLGIGDSGEGATAPGQPDPAAAANQDLMGYLFGS